MFFYEKNHCKLSLNSPANLLQKDSLPVARYLKSFRVWSLGAYFDNLSQTQPTSQSVNCYQLLCFFQNSLQLNHFHKPSNLQLLKSFHKPHRFEPLPPPPSTRLRRQTLQKWIAATFSGRTIAIDGKHVGSLGRWWKPGRLRWNVLDEGEKASKMMLNTYK